MARAGRDGGEPDRPKTFFQHLEEVRQRLKVVVWAFVVAFVIFLMFSFQYVGVLGVPMWLPLPTLNLQESITQQFVVPVRSFLPPCPCSFPDGSATAVAPPPRLRHQGFSDLSVLFRLACAAAAELPAVL